MSTDDRPDILTRARLNREGRATWWVEITPTEPGTWTIDSDAMPFLGVDTQISTRAMPHEARQVAHEALLQLGWQPQQPRGGMPHAWFIERTPPGPGWTEVPVGEDGYLRRTATAWESHTPRISRRLSPAYLTAAAAFRLILRGHDIALPEGYGLDALSSLMAWMSSSSTQHVRVSERQAHEIGEIARTLADHHAEHLEVSSFGDEPWGIAGVLRAMETGHSTPGATPVDAPDTTTTRQETTADAGNGLEAVPGSAESWEDEEPVDEQLDDPVVDSGQAVTLWFPSYWTDHSDVEWGIDSEISWNLPSIPREGEQLFWQDDHRFEVVGVMHTTADHSTPSVHLHLDCATDYDREHLRALGGLCLRDQLILARASGTPWEQLARKYEILPSTLLRYVRDQKELAGDDLEATVIEGGTYGVDISGLDRAAVLAALWNNVRPSGRGGDEILSVDEAKGAMVERGGRISTLRDRSLQVVLTGDRFNPWFYDQQARNFGDGSGHVTAAGVISHLRATGSTTGAPRIAE